MEKKLENMVFVLLFLLIVSLPPLFTDRENGRVSEVENRRLASRPEIIREDGSVNTGFLRDFEKWFNDSVGFRSALVFADARLQYDLLHRLPTGSNMYLGRDGAVNYATDEIIRDYQRFNLKSDAELQEIAAGYQRVSDFLRAQGIQYYYVQCWDKQSIYPEYFPDTVYQYGEESKTDAVMRALEENTDVNVINLKGVLMESKEFCEPYTKYGDPTHWSSRGAYIGYRRVMEEINQNNGGRLKVLEESDYDLTPVDKGTDLVGGIHLTQMEERFAIRDPHAAYTREKLTAYADVVWNSYWVNASAENDLRCLILGDSYFDAYLLDDFAESFRETIYIWAESPWDIYGLIEAYHPDIILNENAERCDRFADMAAAAKAIR